jgi:hypothetical protein
VDILRDLNPLVIARIKIGSHSSQDPELPDSVRCLGKFLLSMLCIEYEKRKVPIANLSILEANTRLKDLIKKYIKKVYPFDHELRVNETASEWWSNLDKDRSNDAQPLAVGQIVIFSCRSDYNLIRDWPYGFFHLYQTPWLTRGLGLHLLGSTHLSEADSK